MVVFGCLTYRNIRQTIVLAEQKADRQLTRMIFIQIALVVISNTAFGAFTAYILITARETRDIDRRRKEYFAASIVSLLNYSYYVVSIPFVML